MHAIRGRLVGTALLLGLALSASYPVYVATYRSMVFQTIPRDDYAPYLLWMAGDDGGRLPNAPMAYRILSVAAALPLYHALPPLRFSKLPAVDPEYLRATHAIAFLSWIALAALAVLAYRTARDRLGASPAAGAAALFATILFAQYTGVYGVDPLAMLVIAAAHYVFQSPAAFALILLPAGIVNEKIVIVFALLLGGRLVAGRREFLRSHALQTVAAAGAVLLYAGVRMALSVPGHERMLEAGTYLDAAIEMLKLSLSLKGAFQNLFPIALVLAAYGYVWRRPGGVRAPSWSPVDVVVPLGLAAIGTAIQVHYTLGRLVFHAMPLIVPAAAAAFEWSCAQRGRSDAAALTSPQSVSNRRATARM